MEFCDKLRQGVEGLRLDRDKTIAWEALSTTGCRYRVYTYRKAVILPSLLTQASSACLEPIGLVRAALSLLRG